MFFKQIFLSCLFSVAVWSATAYGNLKENECIKAIGKYGPVLFQNTLTEREIDHFFECLHDVAEAMFFFTPEPGRDYYTKEELISLLVHFNFSPRESSEMVSRFLAVKKLFVGGKEDRLSEQELKWIYSLMDDYKKVISFLQEDFPLLGQIFSGNLRRELSEKEFQGLSERLTSNLSYLGKEFTKRGMFYQLKDLDKTHEYLLRGGLITSENREDWQTFSVVLSEWAGGIFGPNAVIQGADWKPFLRSLHSLLKPFLYYRVYVAGKDTSHPRIFSRFLHSARLFLSSLQYEGPRSRNQGFPLHRLDKIFQALTGGGVSDAFANGTFGSLWRSLTRNNGESWVLLTRALACFSLPSRQTNCSVRWGKTPTDPVVSYHFPDGQFHFYEDRQKWIPSSWRAFELSADQMDYLNSWLSYWSYNVLSLDEGNLPSYQGQQPALSAWINGFFGRDPTGRIVFDRHNPPSFLNRLSQSFLENDVLIKLVFSSYPSPRTSLSAVNFRNSTFQLSPELWDQAVHELSPVFVLIFQGRGYRPGLKNDFLSLREYADYFLNTANRNGVMDYGELMDLAFHLSSAVSSAQTAERHIKAVCGFRPTSSCTAGALVSEEEILSHFPYLQSRLSVSSDRFSAQAEKLLPEHITDYGDLITLFALLQMVETNFYFLDEDLSFYLEINEVFPLLRALAPKVRDSAFFIHTERQALAFLTYSAHKQTVPFLRRGDQEPFQSIEFMNWTLYPEKWRELKISQTDMFFLTSEFYLLLNAQR